MEKFCCTTKKHFLEVCSSTEMITKEEYCILDLGTPIYWVSNKMHYRYIRVHESVVSFLNNQGIRRGLSNYFMTRQEAEYYVLELKLNEWD